MDQQGDSENWNDEARIACQYAFRCPQTWDRLTLTVMLVSGTGRMLAGCTCRLTQAAFRGYGEEAHCVAVRVLTTQAGLCTESAMLRCRH